MRFCAASLIASLAWSATGLAQTAAPQPLSIIDWLDAQPEPATVTTPLVEPDVTLSGAVPEVTVGPLDETAPRRVGLAPPSVTGLPDTLWMSSSGAALAAEIENIPTLHLPALQSLYYTLLLAEAAPPATEADLFDMARVDALMRLGALDPALALIEQSGPDISRAHFARYFDMALLAGTDASACAILSAQPGLSPGRAHEVFCIARAGDWDTAVLLLGTGRALGLIDEPMAAALERFLDPDLFEGEPSLPIPQEPDPLSFRLFESIGTPIPTHLWPLVYANADLSDTVGWKSRIEAAERLARTGALADNRLLGLYTLQEPAASGGVWDRVEALQRFETALATGSSTAISRTLPAVWQAMLDAQLAVPFAALFADRLNALVLSGKTADVAFEVLLLSPDYERAVRSFPSRAVQRPMLAAVATGAFSRSLEADGIEEAILAAFRDAPADAQIVEQAQSGALGAALFDLLQMVNAGGKGDVARLTTGLATLRTLGLEDVARRTALQILLLEPHT